jgi:hypothetical protein
MMAGDIYMMNYYIATSHSIVVLVYSHVNLFRLAVLIMLLNPFCHPFYII